MEKPVRLDLLIENANVITMDPARPAARSIGIWQGRIAGCDDELAGMSAARVIDLAGRTVLPGFVDAHNHLTWAGLAESALDLSDCTSPAEALEAIDHAIQSVAAGAWLDVVGYDHRALGRHLTSDDLDQVSSGRKIYAIHASGHGALVNTDVLALLGDADLSHPGIGRDEHGRLTGLFLEDSLELVSAIRNPYSLAEIESALQRAGRTCLSQGVTTVAEAGLGGGLISRSPVEVLAYQRCQADGRLPLRVQIMVSHALFAEVDAHPDDRLARALPLGLTSGFGSDRLSLGAVKFWLDGGMMTRTAALTEPYVGTGESGELTVDVGHATELAIQLHAAGWQLALHAIGDRAIDTALDVVEQAQQAHPRPGARHRIEHCGLVRPDQLERLAALDVIVSIQPTFLYAYGDGYAASMGEHRAGWMYRGRSFLDHSIPVAGGSDRPVADGAPLRAIQFMVDRTSSSGALIGADEAITISEALHAYTLGAAFACNLEDRIGSIEAGKLADLVVLDQDPRQADPGRLATISVLATLIGGEVVHGLCIFVAEPPAD
jgi:predicted amidohydrolase YtcJ